MKTKLIAYISLLSILSMGGAVTSCDDELPYSDRSATGNGLTVSEAKEFFEQQMMQIPVTRSSETGNKFLVPENFTPLWSSQTSTEYGNTACMNVPISTLSRFKARYKQNGKYEVVDVWQKLIILKNTESGDMVQFIMSVIPCYSYAKDNPGADIGKIFVQGGDKGDFSGMVLYSLPATGTVFQIATYINGHRTNSANSFSDERLKDNMVSEAKRLSFCKIVATRALEDFGWDFNNGNAEEGAHWLPEVIVDEFGGNYIDDGFSEWLGNGIGNGLDDPVDPPGSNPYGDDDTCDHCHDSESCIGSGGTYASGDSQGNSHLGNKKLSYPVSQFPGYVKKVRDCMAVSKMIMDYFGIKKYEIERIQLWQEQNSKLVLVGDPETVVNEIVRHIDAGRPIIVGVNHTIDNPYVHNTDNTTDHFIVIVGYEYINEELFFNFIETGKTIENANEAVSEKWKLRYDKKTGRIYGDSHRKRPSDVYDLVQIRPNF